MSTIASWNGHKFTVSSKQIYSFTDLTVRSSLETEDKTKKKQKYVKKKNSKPYEISLKIMLDTRFGIKNVKTEAMKICEEARKGEKDYFYFASKKILSCKFMLTEASIDSVEIVGNGTWIICEVKCTFKQCNRIGGGSSSAKKKKKKKSKSSSSKKGTSKKKKYGTGSKDKEDDIDAVSGAAPKLNSNKTKVAIVTKLVRTAANASSKKKTTKKTTFKLGQVK